MVVGWDSLDAPTYRQLAFPPYQGGRQFDAELIEQLDVLPQFVAACGFACAKAPGYEADDFLAAAVAAKSDAAGASSWRVATGTRFNSPRSRPPSAGPCGPARWHASDPPKFASAVPDFIALRGDPSDKLPGASGVGAKSAASLLGRYSSLEALLAAGKFAELAEQLRLYRRIATMDSAALLPPLDDQLPAWSEASALAREWELNRLAVRLTELAQVTS